MTKTLGISRQQDHPIERPIPFVSDRIEATSNIPALVSELYKDAPQTLRAKLLECLLRPVGPLAIVTIAGGAFAHLLYRLRLNGTPISLEDVNRVSPDHVLELAYFVAQSSPAALQSVGSILADSPIGLVTVSSTALLFALSAWNGRRRAKQWPQGPRA